MTEVSKQDIRVLKLVTGESVICMVSSEDAKGYSVENPLQFIISPSPEGVSLAAIPYLTMSFNEKAVINKVHIVTEYAPNEMFVDMYNSQVYLNVVQESDAAINYANSKTKKLIKDKKSYH